MKIKKLLLAVFSVFVLSVGVASYAALSSGTNECEVASSTCGKCGDGYCNPRCGETKLSCPRDCGGSPDTSK